MKSLISSFAPGYLKLLPFQDSAIMNLENINMEIEETFKEIELHGKYGDGKTMLVDADEYDFFNFHRWSLTNSGYAYSWVDGKVRSAHQLVFMGTPYFEQLGEVHHMNGNPLDNRRENLFPIKKGSRYGRSLQLRITKGLGVYWNKANQKWRAQFQDLDGKKKHIGYFDEKEEAIAAYKAKADPIVKIMEEHCRMEWEDKY